MTATWTFTPSTYLLILIALEIAVGISFMVQLLRVNTRILREHKIRRATGLIEGDPDGEGELMRQEEPQHDTR